MEEKLHRVLSCSSCLSTKTKQHTANCRNDESNSIYWGFTFKKPMQCPPTLCWYQEFIIQACLYLLPGWLDQWLFGFVVSENIPSYIALTAQNPATSSFASYLDHDFRGQLSASLVISVKDTKLSVSGLVSCHRSCSKGTLEWQIFLYATEISFCLRCWHSLQVINASTPRTWIFVCIDKYFNGFKLNNSLLYLRSYAKIWAHFHTELLHYPAIACNGFIS